MEGSSESGWQRSNSSRGLNSSFLDRNPRIPRANAAVRISGDTTASHDSVGKVRERILCSDHSNTTYRTQVAGVEALPAARSPVEPSDVSLRQWLDNPERTVNALNCFHIFSQVVDTVNLAHSQGIVVQSVRPSCFVMSSLNRLSFIESASCSGSGSGSGSDSPEYGSNGETAELKGETLDATGTQETRCLRLSSGRVSESHGNKQAGDNINTNNKKHSFPMKQILMMESNWYSPPEEFSGAATTSCASDIYQLGVLLFELFCEFGSPEEKSLIMANLRHRVLPPHLLLKWPKEASFCLWLLHPDPSGRPEMGELLQSEFLNEPRIDIEEREAAIRLCEQIEEQELLLEFLITLQQRKQDAAVSLNETVSFISSDIEEAIKLQAALGFKGGSNSELNKNGSLINPTHLTNNNDDTNDSSFSASRKRNRPGLEPYENERSVIPSAIDKESASSRSSRLMKNFRKVESAYFLARTRAVNTTGCPSGRERHSLICSEKSSISNPALKERDNSENKGNGWVNTFLGGLCKYLAFSKLKVKADLKQGDLLNSANLVCSLSFDRDGELFATAGVNKKIKVFEYNSIVTENRDIHYPVVELSSRSKLSSICWNEYIKGQIASSNFEGVVQVWNVARSEAFMEMREHERRVWSVDFSAADPTLLASGSDDGSVKLWNINQGVSIGTIRTKANVCCVQFPPDSSRTVAFGSADHRIYYYDLRNSKAPLCTLVGHNKTVSYVKFVDSTTLVSASTDNTIKLWDLSTCTSRVLDCPLQSYTGHLNLRNFVGLSLSQGYIATGSETNEVFVYHKDFPMPSLSLKFDSTDPFSGDEVDDTAQFISSVCWRGQSSTLVAANSMGNIKVLEMA